jgi:uncharacterized protein YcbK (DUF882 family)
MPKYTIKSTSGEGVYFLVNGWEKHRTFWISEEEVNKDIEKAKTKFFTAPRYAQASLTKLLKIMDDYKNDHFEIVSF